MISCPDGSVVSPKTAISSQARRGGTACRAVRAGRPRTRWRGWATPAAAILTGGQRISPRRASAKPRSAPEEYGGIEYGGLPVKYSVLHCGPIDFTSSPPRSAHTWTGTPRFAASAAKALSKVARLAWWRIATSRTQQSGNFSPLLARSSARRSGSPSSCGATVMPATQRSSRIDAPCPSGRRQLALRQV